MGRDTPSSACRSTRAISANRARRKVPREFRLASQEYFTYWFEYNIDLYGTAVDCGDVSMPKVSPDVARDSIYRAVREVLKAGLVPVLVGGDRSLSIAATKALSDHIGGKKKMGYLHFGAHLDLADSWAGEKNLAPCALARITELPNLEPRNVSHIGARNAMNPEGLDRPGERSQHPLRAHARNAEGGVYETAQEAIDRVWKKPTHNM